MLKAVLVLLMVSACISKPKHYLIETKDMHHDGNDYVDDYENHTNMPRSIEIQDSALSWGNLLKNRIDNRDNIRGGNNTSPK